jgi:2-keto-4-pentenoate hydratase
MSPEAISRFAQLLVHARRTDHKLAELPADLRPDTLAAAFAIQDATVEMLAEPVFGWKASFAADGEVLYAPLLRSVVFASPARVPAANAASLGVEAEIAFRFDRAMPPRERPYTRAEVADAVTAFVAIEIVDSRYANPSDMPLLCRIADCFSNGAFIAGGERKDWRGQDLAKLAASLSVDGSLVVHRVGGNPAGDCLRPAVAMADVLRMRDGVRAGQVITTGSHTGMNYAKRGQTVSAVFDAFGAAEVTFV